MERFLRHKDKVKITIMFRGREVTHPERGVMILDRLAEELSDLAQVEQRPNLDGRNMTMMLGPSKSVLAGTIDEEQAAAAAEAQAAEAAEAAEVAEQAEAAEQAVAAEQAEAAEQAAVEPEVAVAADPPPPRPRPSRRRMPPRPLPTTPSPRLLPTTTRRPRRRPTTTPPSPPPAAAHGPRPTRPPEPRPAAQPRATLSDHRAVHRMRTSMLACFVAELGLFATAAVLSRDRPAVVGCFVGGFACTVLLARFAARDAMDLGVAAGGVAAGDVDQALPPSGADELGRVAGALRCLQDHERELTGMADAISRGDFGTELVLRGEHDALGRALQRMQSMLRETVGELEHQALYDGLTGLPNRALLRDRLQLAIHAAAAAASRAHCC